MAKDVYSMAHMLKHKHTKATIWKKGEKVDAIQTDAKSVMHSDGK